MILHRPRDQLSASEHIRRIIGDSAQSLYVLRHHGMTEIGLDAVFRAVVVSRLTYASPAWSGFITATDRQRVDAFPAAASDAASALHLTDFNQLLEEADDQLFERILNITHCTSSYFHHNLQHHRTVTSDAAPMTDNCMNTKDT